MIPVTIYAQIASLQTQIDDVGSLEDATPYQRAVLLEGSKSLLLSVDHSIKERGSALDLDDPTGYPFQLAKSLLALAESADDVAALSEMRGFLGRSTLNLAQAGS